MGTNILKLLKHGDLLISKYLSFRTVIYQQFQVPQNVGHDGCFCSHPGLFPPHSGVRALQVGASSVQDTSELRLQLAQVQKSKNSMGAFQGIKKWFLALPRSWRFIDFFKNFKQSFFGDLKRWSEFEGRGFPWFSKIFDGYSPLSTMNQHRDTWMLFGRLRSKWHDMNVGWDFPILLSLSL